MNKTISIVLIILLIVFFFYGCNQNKHFIEINGVRLYIEIALTDQERATGLMYRDKLPEDHGMLFIFEKEQVLNFWMKNTSIPLSIAYIRENGLIIGIYDMKPYDETAISSIYPCKYALEVNRGWFAKNNIKTGDTIKLPSLEILLSWHKEQNK
ncbi:MAG: DUF192 domain-containing protein [Exilispira sp.]